jgi:D-threo-aldose 1-dehydrogenase
VVSTKVGRTLEPNPAPTGSDLAAGGFAVPDDLVRRFDFSADAVLRGLAESLERLCTDQVDLVLVHDPDDHLDQAVAEALPALIGLREQGVVGGVGVGTNRWEVARHAVQESDLDLVMVAGRWTLLDRTGAPLLEACLDRGVSVLAAAPYNSGLLASPWPADGAPFGYRPAAPDLLARARAMAQVCQAHGVSLPDAAIQFPLRHPAVASVVVGLRTPDQVRSGAQGLAAPIPEDCWAELDRLAVR